MSANRTAQIFAWLDRVALDADLLPLAVRVAVRIVHHMNKDHDAVWPAQGTLAADLKKSRKGIQNALDDLKKRGHIRIEVGRGRGATNRYIPILGGDKSASENANRTSHQEPDNANAASHNPAEEMRSGVRTNNAKMRTELRRGCEAGFAQNHKREPLKDKIGREPSHHIQQVDGFDATDPKPASDSEPPGLAEFLAVFPQRNMRQGRRKIASAYRTAIERGHDHRDINAAARAYAVERQGQNPIHTKAMANWLDEDCFLDIPSAFGASAPTLDNETGDFIPSRPPEQPIPSDHRSTRRHAENFAAWGVDPEDVWGITDEA